MRHLDISWHMLLNDQSLGLNTNKFIETWVQVFRLTRKKFYKGLAIGLQA